jgi:hypothetical protein
LRLVDIVPTPLMVVVVLLLECLLSLDNLPE